MIKCVIVDDEPWAVDLLVSYIKKTDFLSLSLATSSPLEALRYIANQSVDLIFLDINMPEMTGIQVMEILSKKVLIIISSAYPQYAVNSYEYNVIDYLLKPIEFNRFLKGAVKVDNALNKLALEKDKSNLEESIFKREFLFIKTDGKLIRVNYDEILYVEGKRDYISIATKTDKLISLDTLANMETILPTSTFIRIHKSFIIALDKIDYIQGNRVCLKNDFLPIGETYKSTLLKVIKN